MKYSAHSISIVALDIIAESAQPWVVGKCKSWPQRAHTQSDVVGKYSQFWVCFYLWHTRSDAPQLYVAAILCIMGPSLKYGGKQTCSTNYLFVICDNLKKTKFFLDSYVCELFTTLALNDRHAFCHFWTFFANHRIDCGARSENSLAWKLITSEWAKAKILPTKGSLLTFFQHWRKIKRRSWKFPRP